MFINVDGTILTYLKPKFIKLNLTVKSWGLEGSGVISARTSDNHDLNKLNVRAYSYSQLV